MRAFTKRLPCSPVQSVPFGFALDMLSILVNGKYSLTSLSDFDVSEGTKNTLLIILVHQNKFNCLDANFRNLDVLALMLSLEASPVHN